MKNWAEIKNSGKSERQAAVNKKVAEIMAGLEEQVVTYNYLAHQIPECETKKGHRDLRLIFNAVKAQNLDAQAKVVDRETQIPGNGFWKGIQDGANFSDEEIDILRTDLAKKHAEMELLDVAPTGKKKTNVNKSMVRAALGF